MAIVGKRLITIQEFKECDIYDKVLGGPEATQYADNYILEAIGIASTNIDHIAGNELFTLIENKKISDDDLNDIKYVCCKYVLHLIRKGLEYSRGQDSSSVGSISWSTSNPTDPFYIIPDVKIVLDRLGLLKNFVIKSLDTPANKGFEFRDMWPYDLDGKGAINHRDADALYIGWDKVISTNGTINIQVDVGTKTNKIIDLTIDLNAVIANFYQNPVFLQMIKSTINDNMKSITDDLVNTILSTEEYRKSIEDAIAKILENDQSFKTSLENAINKLLEKDSQFIKDVAADKDLQIILKTNILSDQAFQSLFAEKVAAIISKDEYFINAVAMNATLINKVIENVSTKMTELLNSTFINLVKNTTIPDLNTNLYSFLTSSSNWDYSIITTDQFNKLPVNGKLIASGGMLGNNVNGGDIYSYSGIYTVNGEIKGYYSILGGPEPRFTLNDLDWVHNKFNIFLPVLNYLKSEWPEAFE